MGIKWQVKCVTAVNSFPVTQLEHNICLLLFTSSPFWGWEGGWRWRRGSTLKPVKKLQGRERVLATACGLWSLLLRPWGLAWLAGGGEGWAASVFKELWPVLRVGEPSLAL